MPLPVNPHQEQEDKRDFTKSHLHAFLTAHHQQDSGEHEGLPLIAVNGEGGCGPGFVLVAPFPAKQKSRVLNGELAERQLYSADYSHCHPVKGATPGMKIMTVLFTTPKAQQLQVALLAHC